jgi:regulator of sirC expression with transglutaminase-like and TPR domain
MIVPLARQHFYQVIHQPEINLAEAALYIAQEEYPALDPDAYLNALDIMAKEVQERLPTERYPLRIIRVINQYLYNDLGFTGNTTDYYDPCNSFLNQVIDRRTGIPITLSLVYLEIARRVDFPMVGVGMPGHFLIRPALEDVEIYIDPFHQGEVLFTHDCQERLAQIYGQSVELQPASLEPISPQQFLARMLTNLKHIYIQRSEIQKCLAAIERILLIFPEAAEELRDRGILYYQLGRWTEACQDLESYLTNRPQAEEIVLIRQLLNRMSREV